MARGGSAADRAAELRALAAAGGDQTGDLERQASAWEAGAAGERVVAEHLDSLPPEFHVLHDRLLNPGKSKANLDHIVISPGGIYLIDAKNWAGTITVHDNNLWQHTPRPDGGRAHTPKHTELDKIAGMAAAMAEQLGRPVIPVLALANKRARGFTGTHVRDVHVIAAASLPTWLTTGHPQTIPVHDVEGTRFHADMLFPPAEGDRDPYAYTTLPGMPTRTTTAHPAHPEPRLTGPRPRKKHGCLIPALGLTALLVWGAAINAIQDDPTPPTPTPTPTGTITHAR